MNNDEILELDYEEATLDESLTSEEMASLMASLAEWDSYSMVV